MIKSLGILATIMIAIGAFNALSYWSDDSKDKKATARYTAEDPILFMIFQECVEGLSIFCAILLITAITAANEYVKEKQFIDLLDVAKDYEVSCIRGQDGTTAPVNAWELVVGDIITFEAGDRIPADCLLLESIDLKVDEAYHNDDVKTIIAKHEVDADNKVDNCDAFLMAESLVVEGSGKAIILVISEPYCSRHRRVLR